MVILTDLSIYGIDLEWRVGTCIFHRFTLPPIRILLDWLLSSISYRCGDNLLT